MNRVVIEQGQLVLPTRVATGDLVFEDGVIAEVTRRAERHPGELRIDARDQFVFPGMIDSQAHFREFTRFGGEDLHSGSIAAAAGGVTSVLEMPDNHPADAHSVATLSHKLERARERCVVHHGFWLRATPTNLAELLQADRAIGVRVALDCSEASCWVDQVFANYPGVVAVHAEDRGRLAARYAMYEGVATFAQHATIRDVDTAVAGTTRALELAARHGTRVHLLHLSSEQEVRLVHHAALSQVTAAVALPHLFLGPQDLLDQGTHTQCNPPIRAPRHQAALWAGLHAGSAQLISSDHCPHSLESKRLDYPKSSSGMPGVEWLLPLLLDAMSRGECTANEIARWTSAAPAIAFGLARKGRLEVGYDADVVVVDPTLTREVDAVRSAAGWSPYAGRVLTGWPVSTWLLGEPVFLHGEVNAEHRGSPLSNR